MRLAVSPILIIGPTIHAQMKKCVDMGFPLVTGEAEKICFELMSLKNSELTNPLVVGDISPTTAGDDIEQRLLKVLEALSVHAMFFSSSDSFTEVILSRFMQVIKEAHTATPTSDSKMAFLRMMREGEQLSFVEGLRRVLMEAPSCLPFYLQFQNSRVPAKHKLLELLK